MVCTLTLPGMFWLLFLFCPTIKHSQLIPAYSIFDTSGRRCSRSPSGSRLATTLVDRYFHHYFLFPFFFPFFFHFPSRPFLIEGVLGSKNLFSESCLKWPHYYREVISDFWFGGSNTRLPSPEGGRQTKSGLDQKTYLAKVVRSGHITMEKWSGIFDLGALRLVCLPPKGEGKQKVARIKKLIQRKLIRAPLLL